MSPARYEGSCLCGRVRFSAAEPFLDFLHCHCTDCRKTHGAAFATSIGVARERFAITAGADGLGGFKAPSGTTRSFCTRCGSKVTVENDGWDAVYVPASLFGTTLPHRPQLHMYVRSRAPWYELLDHLPQWAAGPDDDYRERIPPLKR